MSYVIGVDLGGTRIKCGAVTRDGKVRDHAVAPTRQERGPEHLVRTVAGYVRRAAKELGGPAVAVGIGLSGAVDPNRGPVLLPGKFKDLENFPIVPELRRCTGLPVVADNDARVAMIAEQRFGLARGRDWAVMITLGTGLGSCTVLDGKILRDPHLQFGTQLGFLVMQAAGGRLCLSGARGTAEMFCSATALANAVREGIQRGIPSALSDRYWADPRSVDFAAVAEGARKKDRLCLDELGVWTTNLGWLLVSAVHAYAPQVIIVGGGATKAADLFLAPLRRHVHRHIFRHPRGQRIPIVTSKLGDHAGLLGAAALAWEHAR